jgi:hypothetical protein
MSFKCLGEEMLTGSIAGGPEVEIRRGVRVRNREQ